MILKYLKKIDLASETAANGLECTDMVLGKDHSHYSLIIVCSFYRVDLTSLTPG